MELSLLKSIRLHIAPLTQHYIATEPFLYSFSTTDVHGFCINISYCAMKNKYCLIQLVLLPGFLCQNFDEWFSKGLVVNYKVSHLMNERSIKQFFEM